MLEHIAQFTAFPIITGILIGYIANRIMHGEGQGCCLNLLVGIAGSYVGTALAEIFDVRLLGASYMTNFIFCVIGAVVVLWLWSKIMDNKHK